MPQDIQGKEINAAALPIQSPKPIRKTTKPRKRRSISQGRPTLLTDELLAEIRVDYLDGMPEYKIAQKHGIADRTWRQWKLQDYAGFNGKLADYEHERLLLDAKAVLSKSLHSKAERIALDAATFISETLGRAIFHKKAETEQNLLLPVQLVINAPNGQPLQIDTPVQVQSTPVAESTPITQPEGNNEGVASE